MNKVAKEIFDEKPSFWLGGFHNSLDELLGDEGHWIDNDFWSDRDESDEPSEVFKSVFFVITNPDHPRYNDTFDNLEQAEGATSLRSDTTHAGHIVPEGEAGRIVLFEYEMSGAELEGKLSPILFDYHEIK